jgi:hypothetical protein
MESLLRKEKVINFSKGIKNDDSGKLSLIEFSNKIFFEKRNSRRRSQISKFQKLKNNCRYIFKKSYVLTQPFAIFPYFISQ